MTKMYVDSTDLTAVADEIRSKGGTEEQLVFPAGFVQAIEAIDEDLTKYVYTHDGANRLLVDVCDGEDCWFKGNTLSNRGLTIDWGDGTVDTTDPDTEFGGELHHIYEKGGKYLIEITPIDEYTGSNTHAFFPYLRWGSEHGGYSKGGGYAAIRAVEFGANADLNGSNFSIMDRCDISDFAISLPEEATWIDHINNQICSGCVALRHAKIMIDNGKSIGLPNNFFLSCSSLKDVELADSITSFGNSTFQNCYSLSEIRLPSALTSLGYACFQNCLAMKKIELPAAVTKIGDRCFMYCGLLTSLIIRNTDAVVTNGGSQALYGTPIASGTGYIYVPDALVEDYKAATNWSTYADQIKPLSEYTEG